MKFFPFQLQFKNFVVFSLSDIRKIDPSFHRHQLNQWQDKGYIRKLRRGYYMFVDVPLDVEVLFLIANHLYSPSYVSFETALSYYGLIPEGVYSIISASSKKTANFTNTAGAFVYHTLQPRLLFGYTLSEHRGQSYKMAEPEKAVLDYLYLHPMIINEADFSQWRFDSKGFLAMADLDKLHRYALAFGSARFVQNAQRLVQLIQMAP